MTLETVAAIAGRIGAGETAIAPQLKSMARRGLIKAGRTPQGMGFGLLPFVVGIFEAQGSTMDAELARLFEDYYQADFGRAGDIRPSVHRVVPVNQTVRADMEVHPYESAAGLVAANRAWGIVDCICRKQKALIGEPCGHPLDVCMTLSPVPGAFDGSSVVRALTQDEAMATLRRAADAGLVHSVSNSQQGVWYICNCCTCGCAVLRGMVELGIANVIARSAFVNQVDEALCGACGTCLDQCQFGALSLDAVAAVDATRCVGCGLCVPVCPEGALTLVRRPDPEAPPVTGDDWLAQRAAARGLDMQAVM
jgi:ferredoxin